MEQKPPLPIAIAANGVILISMKTLTKPFLPVVFMALFTAPLPAAEGSEAPVDTLIQPAGDRDLNEFVWKKRPVIIFADSPDDPAFVTQMELLETRPDALIERDVIVLTDTNPKTLSPARKKLRPRGFMLAILNKEGRVQLRKPFPWDVREITRSIDKLPIRKREIRAAKQTITAPN